MRTYEFLLMLVVFGGLNILGCLAFYINMKWYDKVYRQTVDEFTKDMRTLLKEQLSIKDTV